MQRRGSVLIVILLCTILTSCSVPHWPVQSAVTSPYGLRMRGWLPDVHEGVDLGAPAGTPVHAMKSGRVVHAGAWGDYGLAVLIAHGSNVRTLYAHLSSIDVAEGEDVDGGQQIGAVGSTGNATGAHLHFEVWRWGRAEDPVPLLGGFPVGVR